MNLLTLFQKNPQFQTILDNQTPKNKRLVTGLSGAARYLFWANLYQATKQPLLIVTTSIYQANQTAEALSQLLPDIKIQTFPVEAALAVEMSISSPEALAQRVETLSQLSQHQASITVVPIAGIGQLLPPVKQWQNSQMTIDLTSEISPEVLAQQLIDLGYQRQKLVEKPGEFAMRGDIIDIYALTAENPVRIELFDTQVDAMRQFDAMTQRSLENIQSFNLQPATDLLISDQQRQHAKETIESQLKQVKKTLPKTTYDLLSQHFSGVITQLLEKGTIKQSRMLAGYLYEQPTTLMDYFSPEGLVVFDDYPRLQETLVTYQDDILNWQTEQLSKGMVIPNAALVADIKSIIKTDLHQHIYGSLFQKGMGKLQLTEIVNFQMRNVPQFFSQMPALKTQVDQWQKQQKTVIFLIDDLQKLNKFQQTLFDFEINASITTSDQLQEQMIQLTQGTLANGFELPQEKVVLITEKELFNKATKKQPKRRQTFDNAQRLKSYTDLKPGDYVVHINHGIGRFTGMQTLTVDGVHQDYMTIEYRDNGQLFIPVTQLNLIQKYVAAESKQPRINKLGGSEWQKTKQKAAAKIEDIADDLIALYAKRESQKGYAFPKDDELQADFEAQFAFAETADQLRSTQEIKHDMEKIRPMDRLLVGDVGFGKTEVALRAAFKAVTAGKQVAFLVPTTILAQQHYENMQQRFSDFGVRIGLLSRFKTRAQITETLKALKKGQIDIVVGTHRVLSKDVEFQDLGLLIVDEEQRFGVKHKERLKQLKSQVDVLTLTATPIPRTLHMSMLGVRDLSVIETPPTNRYPIQTYVMEQNAAAMREAILRELDRNGQVFYLHNRVHDIERVVNQIQQLVPDATVGFAHGQMTENQLEGVIYDFLQGQYDVLVTTTIIETGVDMPNVNTLIIEDADRYGLSQLYQLRGRVGRSSRIAYAYLMYQPNKVLTEVGEQRLQAIKDFTELGSGFKIAMRDLSIRGAGNLLGKQQHGFIDSVGFDLYTQMLNDAVKQKQGYKARNVENAELDLKVEAYIPDDYIDDQRQKIEFYKRIRQMSEDQDLMTIQSDLIDRFGDYPIAVDNLLTIAQLKLLADQAQVLTIKQQSQKLVVMFNKIASEKLAGVLIFKALSKTRLKATVNQVGEQLQVTLIIQPQMTQSDWLKQLQAFLEKVNRVLLANEVENAE